ncbi:MAG: hypothetical protein HRF45_11380 [Fimbriimonadia bacterium]
MRYWMWPAAVLLLILAASGAFAQKGYLKTPITVFEFGAPEDIAPPEDFDPAVLIRTMLFAKLEATREYRPLHYSRRSAPIQLALEDGRLPLSKAEPPFNVPEGDTWRAVEVGRILRTPFALAGSIESYQYDDATRTGSIVVSLEVYNVEENTVVVSAAVTGKASGGSESDEVGVMTAAIDDAATKMMAEISEPLGIGKAVLDTSAPERRKQISGGFTRTAFLLTAAGVVLALLILGD